MRKAKKLAKQLHREELGLMDQLGEIDPKVKYLPPIYTNLEGSRGWRIGWKRTFRPMKAQLNPRRK